MFKYDAADAFRDAIDFEYDDGLDREVIAGIAEAVLIFIENGATPAEVRKNLYAVIGGEKDV